MHKVAVIILSHHFINTHTIRHHIKLPANPTMTPTYNTSTSNPSLAQDDPQDSVQLARTLRRIKRRLLLEQCGVSLPYALVAIRDEK